MRAIGSEHGLRSENLAFDFDVWYPRLEQWSFPSECIALQKAEAAAIVRYQESRYLSRGAMTAEDVQSLKGLEDRLQRALVVPGAYPDGAFLRLCGRSPKDAQPLSQHMVRVQYSTALEGIAAEHGLDAAKLPAGLRYRAVLQCAWMRVTNGREAMSLLLTSERVFADLVDWIKFGEPEQVVLRQWLPEMSLEREFRAYVHQGVLCAISQYDHYGVFPELVAQKDAIEAAIREMQQEMHPSVGEESYCADFVWLPSTSEVRFIELSPFRACTGAACFRWDHDSAVLRGEAPFEFRLNDREHPQLADVIEMNWVERWKGDPPPYDHFYPPSGWAEWLRPLWQLGFGLLAAGRKEESATTTTLLFCYGTLKEHFHWHSKYMWRSSRVEGSWRTASRYPLVLGNSGVPYLLGDMPDQGKPIVGELYEVDEESLRGLDEYEGVGKGHYERRAIHVVEGPSGARRVEAECYFKLEASEALRAAEMHPEYTLEMHREHYRPIRHIMVKQQHYLGDMIQETQMQD